MVGIAQQRARRQSRTDMIRRAIAVLALISGGGLYGQRLDPVQWTLTSDQTKAAPGGTVVAKLTAKLEPGWHLYSPTTTPGGPIPTSLKLDENPAIGAYSIYQPKPERKFDRNFNLDVEWFEREVTFIVSANLKKDAAAGPLELTALVRYQACDDRQCLPPKKKTAPLTLTIAPGAPAGTVAIPAGYTPITGGAAASSQPAPSPATGPSAVPPRREIPAASEGLARFLLIAFGFGFAAIFTPCVFPMIPITMSFFLNQQSGSRRQGIWQALVFCMGIIVLFSALGFAVTAIAGPFGVVQLGANPWVNGFIALVFFVFGTSLLGAFEITLPSGLLTKLDSASRRGGYAGTLLMGLTFSLTSFACVGPFVGTLLAASVQSGGVQPVLGMVTFAAGLATPFFFLALFPSYLNRLPRSGGWMARVKIVLGFVILAAMFKYLSNVDAVLDTNLLSRGVYLAAWFVLFALPGLYLLGFLRLEGIKPDERLGVGRLLVASAFLIFAVSLLPGMFGASLGPIDAYVPPPGASALTGARGESQIWLQDQYTEALAQARQQNKLVLVTFTGKACTNCHWMKANMFPRPEIAAAVRDMILVELYTDRDDAVSRQNQELQAKLFNTVAIPLYALMDGNGKVVASFAGSTNSTQQFLAFLTSRPQQT
jgi:thiol:disulfide interchange protein